PADVQNTRFLHLSPRDDKDQQWLWAPTTRRTRRLGDAQRDENFFGTDLSYRDLELLVRIQQWNDSEATATLLGEETVGGHPCRVGDAVPKTHSYPYTKYRLWFGTEDSLLWRVDVYQDDEGLKRVTPKKYDKIGPYQTAVESDIATLPANTKTIFTLRNVHYDAGVPEGVFTVSNLDKG